MLRANNGNVFTETVEIWVMDFAAIEAKHSVDLKTVVEEANTQSAEEREQRGITAVKSANQRLSVVLLSAIAELKTMRITEGKLKAKVAMLDAGIKSEERLVEIERLSGCGDAVYYIRQDLVEGGVSLPKTNAEADASA